MVHAFVLALLACGTPAVDEAPAPPSIDLPGKFEPLLIPTEGATVHSFEGDEMVLHYPGATSADIFTAYADALNKDGWQLDEPQNGGRFVRVQANKNRRHLEYFIVKQPERTEVHLEWVDK